MLATDAMTEGDIMSTVLSFLSGEFLYTGAVSTAWRRDFSVDERRTNVLHALASAATVKQAVESGICTINLFDLAVVFGVDKLVLQQLLKMGVRRCHETTLRYAAYTGNLDAVRLICVDEYCDARDIFEAVRGGHIDVVRCAVSNSLPEASTPTVSEIPEWRSNVYDSAFMKHCRYMASVNARHDVAARLDAYLIPVRDRNISCLDLAKAKSRPDIVGVLRGKEW